MSIRNLKYWSVLASATALVLPNIAQAETTREADLAARLEQLEAQMQQLRADLAAARAEQAQTIAVAQAAQTQASQTATAVTAMEARPRPEGFRVGSTTVRLGGFIKLAATSSHFSDGEVASNSFGLASALVV